MYRLHRTLIGTTLALGLGLSAVAQAQDQKTPAGGPDAAMMQAAQKYMTPNENHRRLDPTVGKFTAKVSMWMKPDDKAQVSEGSTENVWALNGHFLQGTYKGTFNGQPFEGIGYTGYDNVREEYQMLWLDGMGTGMMYSNGKYDPATKAIVTTGTSSCPMTGDKNMWYRSELKISGPNKHTYSSYSKGPDGKEYKAMEIVYTRAK